MSRDRLWPLRVLLALTTIALGVALLVVTLLNGGGEVGLVVGLLFIAAGAGRLYLVRSR
jgi:hypothetical protein